jgi:hypothetical protein
MAIHHSLPRALEKLNVQIAIQRYLNTNVI